MIRGLLVTFLLGIASGCLKPSHATVPQSVEIDRILSNGLRVIAVRDPASPQIAVTLVVPTGGRADPIGKSGIAHLVEHFIFYSDRRPGSATGALPLASQFGFIEDAETDYDYTRYTTSGPSGSLAPMLWFHSERLRLGPHLIDPKRLPIEIEGVANERRERLDGSLYGRASEQFMTLIYPQGHPYSRLVIGTEAELASLTASDVLEFAREHFRPDGSALVIVGNFEKRELAPLIDAYFVNESHGRPARRNDVDIANTRFVPARRSVQISDGVPQPLAVVGWTVGPSTPVKDVVFGILAQGLSGGPSSVLRRRLVDADKVASSVKCLYQRALVDSIFFCQAVSSGAQPVDEVAKKLEIGIVGAIDDPSWFGSARNRFQLDLAEDVDRVTERSEEIALSLIYWGRPETLGELAEVARRLDHGALRETVRAAMPTSSPAILSVSSGLNHAP